MVRNRPPGFSSVFACSKKAVSSLTGTCLIAPTQVSKTATALVRKYYRSIFSAGNKISKSHFVEADQSGGSLL